MKNFVLIGAGGYIAPRHLKAIKESGSYLSASMDLNDSVGVLDQYFPRSRFFLDYNLFSGYIEKTREELDYLSICTPNHFHAQHIQLAIQNGLDAICEKPVVINPAQLDDLSRLEETSGKKIFTILQLRHHSKLLEYKKLLGSSASGKKKEVVLTYITGRGNWYFSSWKGNPLKSGGIAVNIGIHLFDLLVWLFGNVKESKIHLVEPDKMAGYLELDRANVKWFLSIDFNDLPENSRGTFRSIKIDDSELEFSDGFTDLHTVIYKKIIEGEGVGIETARPSIELVHRIMHQSLSRERDLMHPSALNL